jgi:hypothetical protein
LRIGPEVFQRLWKNMISTMHMPIPTNASHREEMRDMSPTPPWVSPPRMKPRGGIRIPATMIPLPARTSEPGWVIKREDGVYP